MLGHRLPFDSLKALRAQLIAAHPHFAATDAIVAGAPYDAAALIAAGGACASAPFVSPVADYYLTNPIARASVVMAECSALRLDLARQAAE